MAITVSYNHLNTTLVDVQANASADVGFGTYNLNTTLVDVQVFLGSEINWAN